MKAFFVRTTVETRKVNANEYSVAPKTNTFQAEFNGQQVFAASTAGKGKSAIPNYYLYFRAEGILYYFRSNPSEIAAAKTKLEISTTEFPVAEEGQGEQVQALSEALESVLATTEEERHPAEQQTTPVQAPAKGRRQRASK